MNIDEKRKEFEKLRRVFKQQLPEFCANCSKTNNLHIHHIVPLALGGNNVISNFCVLCGECHGILHGKTWYNHSELVKRGIAQAKLNGRYGGRPKVDIDSVDTAVEMYRSGNYTKSRQAS